MTTMTGIQREAIRRAQRGEWELADALELAARLNERTDPPPMLGLQVGGRLQLIVFIRVPLADCECCDCEDSDDCLACRVPLHSTDAPWIDWDNVARIEHLNGDIVYHEDTHDRPPYEIDNGKPLNKRWADEVLAEYYASLARAPTQSSLPIEQAA